MKQTLIAVDQVLNTLAFFLPGKGWADESLSARAWRVRDRMPTAYKVIDAIFFWQKDHCEQSYMSEIKRLQSPPDERQI